ncbi:MBL fold metallo-hydrolase [Rhodopseudomonas palustris]|uniref:MBL fold metallo-hydrolase n=1 Tax=Rhodopseudomonas palustris TaxID=1076 RepID=UPI0020CD56C3|nr:MBL fold metallo-hydrolase [Rhodopseudomonas palustris]MCP9629406.1 MBL fold metallo-hydrolase [Rhodopseudomonas palustris]
MSLDRRTLLQLSLAGSVAGALGLKSGSAAAQQDSAESGVKWICLGTKGGPRIGTGRSNPANVLLVDGVPFVIDCGYGVARRLVEAKVALPSLRYVFVTHMHSDHVLEFGNMIYGAWSAGLNHQIDAFGPVGLDALAQAFWTSMKDDIEIRMPDEGKPDPRKFLVVKEITESGPVLATDKVNVTALRTPHPPILERNYAYKFETPKGVIVYVCDSAYNPEIAKFAEGADLLIHEALYVPGVDALAARIKNASTLKEHLIASHTTTEDLGKLAAAAKVKKLVMTHLVPGDIDTISDEMWMQDVRKHYTGPLVVARDLMEISL